MDRNRKSI